MKRSSLFRAIFLLILPLFVVVTACDSNDDDSTEVQNEFTMDVTSTSPSSAITPKSSPDTSLQGFSFFVSDTDPDTGDPVFAIYFTGRDSLSQTSAQQGLYGFLARKSDQPSTGEYTIADVRQINGIDTQDFAGLVYEKIDAQDPNTGLLQAPFHFLTGGTLELTESTDNRVSGTIDGQGVSFTLDTSGQTPQYSETSVQITGSFTARNVQNFVTISPQGGV